MGLLVMKRMHWSERDYLEASMPLVEAIVLDMVAESNADETRKRWAER